MPTPARLRRDARSSPSSVKASRKVKIGAVATRIPVSEEESSCSPTVISMSGACHLQYRQHENRGGVPRTPDNQPMRAASGNSTSAARAVRPNTITTGGTSSSSATLMNR